MSVLVIAAHPDDEVLGCGGTLARLSREGRAVHLLILGEGITSRQRNDQTVELEMLRKSAKAAAALLGAEPPFFMKFPDNQFDSVPLLDIVKGIEKVIEKVEPQTVFIQHGGDLNVDHAITFRAGMTAVRPMNGSCVKELYAFEVSSSTEWSLGQFSPCFQPNYFVDISETIETKFQALRAYQSELREFPHPRSLKGVEALARYRGTIMGFEAAEAFQMIWSRKG